MNAGLQFGVERFHDGAMLRETSLSGECGRSDAHTKMRFAGCAPARMAPMFFALVDHFKVGRREFDRKFFDNDVSNRHMHTVSALVTINPA